jgi:hypothetical protein
MAMPHMGPSAALGSGAIEGRYSEFNPCMFCGGLGFVSWLSPAAGLTRRVHANGRETWEGDCPMCGGSGRAE